MSLLEERRRDIAFCLADLFIEFNLPDVPSSPGASSSGRAVLAWGSDLPPTEETVSTDPDWRAWRESCESGYVSRRVKNHLRDLGEWMTELEGAGILEPGGATAIAIRSSLADLEGLIARLGSEDRDVPWQWGADRTLFDETYVALGSVSRALLPLYED